MITKYLQKWFLLISQKVLAVEMRFMAHLGDINDTITKIEFIFYLMITGDATRDFLCDHFFKLNSFKTTEQKHGTID